MGSDVAGTSSLDSSSAVEDVKKMSVFDSDYGEVNAQSGMDGGSTSLDAKALRISLPFNPGFVHPDTLCIATASDQTHPLTTSSPFNTTSFLASYLFRSRESSLNHAILPIGSFPQPQTKPPLDLVVSPVRQSLGLDPETLENMPSFQPSTADEERARRREAMRHQGRSQFPDVLRHADALRTASAAAATQGRESEARPKRTDGVKDTQTRDKTAARRFVRQASHQTGDAQPDPTSLKSTVTPVFWDNPLKSQPHIYNPSPIGRPANYMPAKITTPRGGGRTREATPRRSAESVCPRPGPTVHHAAHIDPPASSKQLAAPVVRSKPTFIEECSKAPAPASSSSTAVLTVQLPDTHSSTLVLRISHEPRPPVGASPSTPFGLQTGATSSKSVAPTATGVVYRGVERYDEWHKKRVDTKYLDEPELYQKLVDEGRVPGGMHRPPKAIEPDRGAKREKSPEPSINGPKSTTHSNKGLNTSLTESTESLTSSHSSKDPRHSSGGSTGGGQVVQKDCSSRPGRRYAAKLTTDTSQSRVKSSSAVAQRTLPSTRDQSNIKQSHSRPVKGVSSTPFPTVPSEDGTTHDGSSLKRAKKPWDGSTRAEERSEVSSRRSMESVANSSPPPLDPRSRAPLTSHRAEVRRPGARASDASSIGTPSLTKSSRQDSLGKPQGSRSSLTESLRTVDSVRKSSHKSSSRNGITQPSQPEGTRKRMRTLSTTATISDVPVLDMLIDDWPSPQDLISEKCSSSVTSRALQDASPGRTPVLGGKQLQTDPMASTKNQQLEGRTTLVGPTEKVATASSTHKPVLASNLQADEVTTTTSDAPLQRVSRRSSGVSYLTVDEPSPKDPATPPVTLRTPMARQPVPHSPLLHRCFESMVTDANTYSVVTDNFDPESYPLGYDFRAPLPSIPGQVVSARPEVIPHALDLPTFTRGRIEPVWPALKAAIVDLKPATRSVATAKEVRFTESSSEESLLEHAAPTARQSARLTIFPNASTVTISTSSGSGSSLVASLLPTSMEWPVPPIDIPQKRKEAVEDPPSYNDSVPTRKRTQSDATDKKDRLLLNARLPAPYIDSLIRTREANMACASAQAQRDAEQSGRTRKPSTFKKILGQLRAPFSFKKKKEEDGQGALALSRSVSAQPRAGPSTIHWKSQVMRK